MRFEFLVLADSAQVADGKLYMLGGGWSAFRSPTYPTIVPMAFAVSVLFERKEIGKQYPLSISITADDPAKTPIATLKADIDVGQPPIGENRAQRALFAFNMQIPLPGPGEYLVTASSGSSRLATPFEAVVVGTRTATRSLEAPKR
jgi:hypothetical protein